MALSIYRWLLMKSDERLNLCTESIVKRKKHAGRAPLLLGNGREEGML